jgi:hypothetical protein
LDFLRRELKNKADSGKKAYSKKEQNTGLRKRLINRMGCPILASRNILTNIIHNRGYLSKP